MPFGLSPTACLIWWFAAGMLAGWILYWLLDKIYMRSSDSQSFDSLEHHDQLTRANARYYALKDDYDRMTIEGDDPDDVVAKLRAEIAALSKAASSNSIEIEKLQRDLAEAQVDAGAYLRIDSTGQGASVSDTDMLASARLYGFQPRASGADDLTIIEGVGPKIAELLKSSGLDTFAKLAATDAATLRGLLNKGGKKFQLANPETWPEQAKLCVEWRWRELKELQDRVSAFVKKT